MFLFIYINIICDPAKWFCKLFYCIWEEEAWSLLLGTLIYYTKEGFHDYNISTLQCFHICVWKRLHSPYDYGPTTMRCFSYNISFGPQHKCIISEELCYSSNWYYQYPVFFFVLISIIKFFQFISETHTHTHTLP